MGYLLDGSKKGCTGCTACVSVCPCGALSMHPDDQGFLYPVLDTGKCVHCNLCKSVCPAEQETENCTGEVPRCFAIRHKDESVRGKSQSGGLYTCVIENRLNILTSGTVYGASLDTDNVVRHHRAKDVVQAEKFRESKYVQSDIGKSFTQVESELLAGRAVLFTGTPCQVEGLRRYLNIKKIDTHKLYLADLVCDGVPSPQFFHDYLCWVEKRRGTKLTGYKFRDKSQRYPWGTCVERLNFGRETVYSTYYVSLFGSAYITRPSCFACPYATVHRHSDITMGDFWGVEKHLPEFWQPSGCSLALVHTPMGLELWKAAAEQAVFQEVDVEAVLQPRLEIPVPKPENYDQFWQEYQLKGIDFVIRKYGKEQESWQYRANSSIKRVIKFPFHILKKIAGSL